MNHRQEHMPSHLLFEERRCSAPASAQTFAARPAVDPVSVLLIRDQMALQATE